MKNRFLRFTFVVFLSGLTSIMMALTVDGDQNNNINKNKKMTSGEYLSKVKNNQNTGSVSIGDVIAARKASQALMNNKSANTTYQWDAMGPNNMGGPTKAIIFDNRDNSGNTLYAGSTNGGLWISTNYAATWEIVEMSDVLNISSICQADDGTIYVGSGVSLEPAAEKLSEGSTIGKGIYKSTTGNTFELMPGTAPSGDDIDGEWAFIQKIAVDGSGNVYAATNTGLKFYNGTEWSYAQADGVNLEGKCCDVIIKGGAIITAVEGLSYISLGDANGFTVKAGEEDQMLPVGNFGNIKFAISSSNNDYIYASYVDIDGALYNIYLSTDKGNNWRVIYPGGSSLDDIFNGQGLRNNSISVDPNNEQLVYVGAHNIYKGYEAQPTGYYNWSQITNGILNPHPTMGTSSYVHFGINTIVFHPNISGHSVIGSDGGMSITKDNYNSMELINRNYNTTEFHTINASKAGTILGGAQFNGVQRIYDNGANQADELLLNPFLGPSHKTGGYSHISYINPEFYVCSADDGTFWRSEDMGVNRNQDILEGITTGNEFISPFLMWESQNNTFSGKMVEFTASKDYNAGDEAWVQSNNYDFPFITVLDQALDSAESIEVQDLVSSKCFLAVEGELGTSFSGGLYMTTGMLDYSADPEWWQIGSVVGIPTCMAYSKDANYVWVGTLEGRLFKVSNILRATSQETADISNPSCIITTTEISLATTQAITSISVDSKDADNIVFTLGNYGNSDYVFASTNGMSDSPTFESIQGNLPEMPVYSSTFEVTADGLVFIGTENGLFYTENFNAGSVTWNYEDANFGNVPVFALKQQSINWPTKKYPLVDGYLYYPGAVNYGAIYVGTFGAGAYVSKDFVGFEEFENSNNEQSHMEIYPNPAQELIHISIEATTNNHLLVEVYDLSGKLIIQKQYESQVGNTTLDLGLYDIENGSYIVRLTDGQKQYQSKVVISK